MAERVRYLIGYGERLTEPVAPARRGGSSLSPYDPTTARARLTPMVAQAVIHAQLLPESACPDDRVVSALTLHPSFIAKSYFPTSLLDSAGFTPLGSKPVSVVPDLVTTSSRDEAGKKVVQVVPGQDLRQTTQLFVESTRSDLRKWLERLTLDDSPSAGDNDLTRVESFSLPLPEQRLRISQDLPERVPLEVVLHGAGVLRDHTILIEFARFAATLGAETLLERRYDVGSLSFVPVEIGRDQIRELAEFSFLRVARVVPRLRGFSPFEDLVRISGDHRVSLPSTPALDPELRVAVFDGGLPDSTVLAPWATDMSLPGLGLSVPAGLDHGQGVTSAILFGSVDPRLPVEQPFAHVDHYRVMDDSSQQDPFELFDVIARIETVLSQRNYDFVNLSIGPYLSVEDDEVHAWTAFIDNHLRDGSTLLTSAVGNNGELDVASGNARIQVPSDSVNALAVGAADSGRENWNRATYSAIGPGRSPGIVKPDVIAFGGCEAEPFITVAGDGAICQTAGTSFAAPLALRAALGVRAVFGERLDPLTLKALLVHTAEASGDSPNAEHGWGRIVTDIGHLIECRDGMARVIYQGELLAGKYLRARIPVPDFQLKGNVTISATMAVASDVDPGDPSNYTRSGIEVVFRPHEDVFATADAVHPKSKPFFLSYGALSEAELRHDSGKWETMLSRRRAMRGTSLKQPVFDIHHIAREFGHATRTASSIRYAMIVTVESQHHPDLYEHVLRTYSAQLEALVPVITLPLSAA